MINSLKAHSDSKTNQVKITFDTSEKANVTVEVKDEKEQIIASLVKGDQMPLGSQLAIWDASEVSNVHTPLKLERLIVIMQVQHLFHFH
ncbi:hypothetical protein H7T43_00115 [Peribacillus simplex]|uniref:hypothetical protein n=1 Tax=Peribacillus simplex TaxID=1478 RepID=UPI002989E697|nr:hypothetical protein [Peribacillus simplex]MBX9953319.1 hypothetical protein [Peribacillus simplex]